MRFFAISLTLLLGVFLLGSVVTLQESFATEPCFLSPQAHWNSYDDIYTGKVVSITNQTTDARIDFELEHLLKGNPPLTWNKNVPFETFRGVGIPGFGADHFTVGSEIFYIENYNHNGPSNSGGYCGIGEMKVEHKKYGNFFDFFEYYEELYGKPVPQYIENNNQESFAQTNDLSDYLENWYLGENLKEGDYFEYSLCELDLNDCAPIELRMWIKGTIPYGSVTLWDTKVVIFDGDKIIKGSWGLGKISPEPVTFDDDLFDYAMAFKSSLGWLGAFDTRYEDDSVHVWGNRVAIGGSLFLLEPETISIASGIWETVLMSWKTGGNATSKIWIVDDFPFPVKASTLTYVSEGIPPPEYIFELLDYKEIVQTSHFEGPVLSLKQQLESGVVPENIQCRENNVLVQRTNGNLACVSERTAERMGWEILQIEETITEPTLEERIERVESYNDPMMSYKLDNLIMQLEVRNYIEINGWPEYSEEQVITQATEYIESIDSLFLKLNDHDCGLVLHENLTVGKSIIDDKPYHNIPMGFCNVTDPFTGGITIIVNINTQNMTDISNTYEGGLEE